jgi:hypothetical protein
LIREEVYERTDAERDGEFFDGVLVAREGATVDEYVKAGVVAFDDDVHGCGHCESVYRLGCAVQSGLWGRLSREAVRIRATALAAMRVAPA